MSTRDKNKEIKSHMLCYLDSFKEAVLAYDSVEEN